MGIRDIYLLPLFLAPLGAVAMVEQAIAQTSVQVKATTIQVETQADETLYFNPDTTYELPVVVRTPVVVNGRSLAAGTVIQGRLEPTSGGLRYVATEVTAGGFRTPITASSDVLHDVKDPRETSVGSIAGDAAIGAAGGAVVGAILGDGVGIGEVIGGAAAGAIIGNVTAQRVVVIEPGQTINLLAQ